MKPTNAIVPESACVKIVAELNGVLANEYALFTKTLNYHWNVTGPRFHSLHVFLEGQYRQLLEVMDTVAERVRILNHHPISTIHGMVSAMELKDGTQRTPSAEEMLRNLLSDHMSVAGQIKEIVAEEALFKWDPGSMDMLINTLRQHELMGWMLKAHVVE